MATANELNLPNATTAPVVEPAPYSALGSVKQGRLAGWVKRVPVWLWKCLLVFSDIVLIEAAFVVAYFVRYQLQWFRTVDPVFQVDFAAYAPFAVALAVVLPVAFALSGVYPYRRGRSLSEETWAIATATTAGVVVLISASLIFKPLLYSRLIFLYTAGLVTILLTLNRYSIQLLFGYLRNHGVGTQRMLLVGAGEVGRMIMRTVAARPDYGYTLVGFLDDNPAKGTTDIGPFRALGPVENVNEILGGGQVDTLVICLPWQSHLAVKRLLHLAEQAGVQAKVVPDLFQLTMDQVHVEDLNGIPLFSPRAISIRGWNLLVKRASDLVIGGLMGLVTLPLTLLIALAIKLDTPGPVLFTQARVGRNGRAFKCYKFRSMVEGAAEMQEDLSALNEATGPLFKVRNDPRRTRVGRWLRRYSLDELPQLINVLAGEMSLVGPRPNLPDEVAHYADWHSKRLTVSPGITGLWQVSGRSDLTFDEMVLLDIYYVENWSLTLDLSILLRSLPAVLRGRGAY